MAIYFIPLLFTLLLPLALAQQECYTNNWEEGRYVTPAQCMLTRWEITRYWNQDDEICCPLSRLQVVRRTLANPQPTDTYEAALNPRGAEILKSLSTECGIIPPKRVANGKPVRLAEFPWMALLRYNSSGNQFQCGGSLITKRYVLTAAHCVKNVIGVRLGEHDLSKPRDCARRGPITYCTVAEDFGVESVVAHDNYQRNNALNDIALVRLDRDVEFRDNIKPVCLPLTKSAAEEEQTDYFIAGWGLIIGEAKTASSTLLKATIQVKSRQSCQSQLKSITITNNHICASGDDGTNTCQGDSGGPLFAVGSTHTGTRRYVQFGVTSFGSRICGDANTYGLFANVADLMPWITSNIS